MRPAEETLFSNQLAYMGPKGLTSEKSKTIHSQGGVAAGVPGQELPIVYQDTAAQPCEAM